MTTIDQTLKMALSALENHAGNYKLSDAQCVVHNAAIESLRAALSKAGQDAQDAERYRWLRSIGHEKLRYLTRCTEDSFEPTIDAAIKEQAK